jgi:hypothetical protein
MSKRATAAAAGSELKAATAKVLGEDPASKAPETEKAQPRTETKPAPAHPGPSAPAPIAALLASSFKTRESGVYFNTHEAVPESGTPIEHILRRDFWAHVAQRMRLGDTVLVLPRDGAFYAELAVWDAGLNWADVSLKFAPVMRPKFEPVPGVDNQFEIGRDPINGIFVRHRVTGQIVKTNFPNHQDALNWSIQHQKALRA